MRIEPFRNAVAITPHDTNPSIIGSPVGVYVGGAGAITCTLSGGSADVVFAAVPVGAVLDVELSAVKATGTTATNLLALYE
jgi:hypothetical protein